MSQATLYAQCEAIVRGWKSGEYSEDTAIIRLRVLLNEGHDPAPMIAALIATCLDTETKCNTARNAEMAAHQHAEHIREQLTESRNNVADLQYKLTIAEKQAAGHAETIQKLIKRLNGMSGHTAT